MSFYSQKYALQPEKIDEAVDKSEAMPAGAVVTTTALDMATLKAALPTTNPGLNMLWNDEGVIKLGTA